MQNEKKQEFKALNYRKTVVPSDLMNVANILKSTEYFKPHEIDIAIELVEERLNNGDGSGYRFIFLEIEGKTVGYSCYGEIPLTLKNFDLYWIAIENNYRGKGLGRLLMKKTEADIAALGGRGIYIETSNKEIYKPTMTFYKNCEYEEVALFKDFYDINDHKVVFYKKLLPE